MAGCVEDRGFQHLVSERLLIRRFRPEDARALATYRSDPEVARLQAWQAPYTQKAAAAFIASLETLWPGIPETWFQFAVGLRKGEPLIGDLGLRLCDDPRQAEVGFTLAGSYQGKGYALEALRCLLRYVFEGLSLHRVFSYTDLRNERGQRLLQRAGFREEGRLMQASWFKGEWVSECVYAQLASEWRSKPDR